MSTILVQRHFPDLCVAIDDDDVAVASCGTINDQRRKVKKTGQIRFGFVAVAL
jgi:hypothetical protein